MNRLEVRVVKLERGGGWRSWRAFIGRPIVEWPDEALHGIRGAPAGWPPEPPPTDAEDKAILVGWGEPE